MEELSALAGLRRAMIPPRVVVSKEERSIGVALPEPPPAAACDEDDDDEETRNPAHITCELFLEDGSLVECLTTVVAASATEVVVAGTVFHPQGGGQPCDVGEICCGEGVFVVEMVKASRRTKPTIVHTGFWRTGSVCEPGAGATLRIDARRRAECARLHSAGHALDAAMKRAGRELPAVKGYHFPDGAYVEYDGSIAAGELPALISELNGHFAAIVLEDAPTRLRRDPNGDRLVSVAGLEWCPCGGTHVVSTSHLGVVTVTKIKNKAKKLRVSYSISPF